MRKPIAHHSGFTLIEMSIVLMIIGLIVGGVLVGRDLIKAAEVRHAVTELQQFQVAFYTFEGKYDCVPGDCTNATSFLDSSRYVPAAMGCSGNGNGNGLIDTWPCEAAQAIQSLSAAGLAPITPTSQGSTVYSPGAFNVPYGYLFSGDLYGRVPGGTNTLTWAGYSGPGGCLNGATLSPNQASAIDAKMDDGKPATGIFLGLDAAGGNSNCSIVGACGDSVTNTYLKSDIATCRTLYYLK